MRGASQPHGSPAREPESGVPGLAERARPRGLAAIAAIVLAVALLAGVVSRWRAHSALRADTARLSVPVVSVVRPERRAAARSVVLPATLQAWSEAPIYARASGYLKRWTTDIGARVHKGDLLAEIDAPDLDQQLHQARADLAMAEANHRLATITARRYHDLLKSDSVSKQDADNAAGDEAAKLAMKQAAEANLRRLGDLQTFERLYAPFDGVVTARNVDVGALVDAGGGAARELFHVAQTEKLRAYVRVPQSNSLDAKPGAHADLTLAELPGRTFAATLVGTASAIDASSRTLLAEFEVPNENGELLPGAYASLRLEVPLAATSFLLPVDALLFRAEGLRVATVGSDDGALLKGVSVGRDLGKEVEIVGGLDGSERVILSPPDSIVDGDRVRPVEAKSTPDHPKAAERRS